MDNSILNFMSTNSNSLVVNTGKKGYIKGKISDGFSVIRINLATSGYEIKIDGVDKLDDKVAEWLGVDKKTNSKSPNIPVEFTPRVLALVEDEAMRKKMHIFIGSPHTQKEQKERLEKIIEKYSQE